MSFNGAAVGGGRVSQDASKKQRRERMKRDTVHLRESLASEKDTGVMSCLSVATAGLSRGLGASVFRAPTCFGGKSNYSTNQQKKSECANYSGTCWEIELK